MEWMKHRSSTIFAVCGSNSLTHAPLLPCCWNLNAEPASGSDAWFADMQKLLDGAERHIDELAQAAGPDLEARGPKALQPAVGQRIGEPRAQPVDARARDGGGLVGRVVEHLDLQAIARVVHLGHRIEEARGHRRLVEERELDGDDREVTLVEHGGEGGHEGIARALGADVDAQAGLRRGVGHGVAVRGVGDEVGAGRHAVEGLDRRRQGAQGLAVRAAGEQGHAGEEHETSAHPGSIRALSAARPLPALGGLG